MDWYEEEVMQLIQRRDKMPYQPQTIFYGSSTMRLWESLYDDFKDYQPVNLGFGGSTLAACVWYFNRIIVPLQNPQRMFIYAGDNDLGDGRNPEEVLIFFKELAVEIQQHFPHIPCHYISVKPSISRWNINESIKRTNQLIEAEIKAQNNNLTFLNIYNSMIDKNGYPKAAYFEEDGLHLSKEGYEVWKELLLPQLASDNK